MWMVEVRDPWFSSMSHRHPTRYKTRKHSSRIPNARVPTVSWRWWGVLVQWGSSWNKFWGVGEWSGPGPSTRGWLCTVGWKHYLPATSLAGGKNTTQYCFKCKADNSKPVVQWLAHSSGPISLPMVYIFKTGIIPVDPGIAPIPHGTNFAQFPEGFFW